MGFSIQIHSSLRPTGDANFHFAPGRHLPPLRQAVRVANPNPIPNPSPNSYSGNDPLGGSRRERVLLVTYKIT